MEIVIVEKKTFEALLAAAETLVGKVGELCRHCSDQTGKQMARRAGGLPPDTHKPANLAGFARQPDDRLRAGEPQVLLQAGGGGAAIGRGDLATIRYLSGNGDPLNSQIYEQ